MFTLGGERFLCMVTPQEERQRGRPGALVLWNPESSRLGPESHCTGAHLYMSSEPTATQNRTGAWDKSKVYKRLHFREHRPLCHVVMRSLQTCNSLDFGVAATDSEAGNRPNAQARCHSYKNRCKRTRATQQHRTSVNQ